MIEIPEKKAKGKFGEIVIVSALFMASFYFLFSDEVEMFLRRNNLLPTKKGKNKPYHNINPSESVDQSLLEGRSEFCSKLNIGNCINGFVLPDDIEDLYFKNNYISVITLPDSIVFGQSMDRNGLNLYRSGNDLVFSGKINGIKKDWKENYNDIKNKVVLMTNEFYK